MQPLASYPRLDALARNGPDKSLFVSWVILQRVSRGGLVMSQQTSPKKDPVAPFALSVTLARAALIGAAFIHVPAWAGDRYDPQILQAVIDAAPRLDFGSIPLETPIAAPP